MAVRILEERGREKVWRRFAPFPALALLATGLAAITTNTAADTGTLCSQYCYRSGRSAGPYGGSFYSRISETFIHDTPGWTTYQLRADGYARTFATGSTLKSKTKWVEHSDSYTCTGGTVTGISLGGSSSSGGSISVSGGLSLKTLTWTQHASSYKLYHYYRGSGQFRCKLATAGKWTRRARGTSRVGSSSFYDSATSYSRTVWFSV